MKLKVQNEDFRVEEKSALEISAHGEYGVYILRKSGWNTADALVKAARSLGVPYSIFSYGGRKDRHALTSQMVTARSSRDLTVDGDGFSLELLGRSNRPMGPDLIERNHFEICLRSLSDEQVDLASRRELDVRCSGLPNYFDDQRFGSMDRTRGFVGERILKGHWKGALELYLTAEHIDETKAQRERREFYASHWDDWAAARSGAASDTERAMLEVLIARPKDYVAALKAIPREEMSLLFSSFQSFLWNEMARRLMKRLDMDLGEHSGDAGPYLFYSNLPQDKLDMLRTLTIPTHGSRPAFTGPHVEVLYDSVLLERGLHRGSFNLRRLRQAYFKSTQRQAIVIPDALQCHEAEADELHQGRLKMLVKFSLPRGAYGTMVIKALMTDVWH